MASPSTKEIEDTQVILGYLFGGNAKDWGVNYKLIDELGSLLAKLSVCNTVFNLLPRPGFIDAGYFRRQLAQIATRLRSGTGDYNLCKIAINYGHRRHFEILSTTG